MLNESLELARSLGRCGVPLPPSHPSVKEPGRAEALWVRLEESGAIDSVAHLSGDRMAELWTVRQGKHNSLPRVVVRSALCSVEAGHPLRKALLGVQAPDLRRRAEVLRTWLAEAPRSPTREFDVLWDRLKNVRAKELLAATDPAVAELGAWRAFLERFSQSPMTGQEFLERLAETALLACLQGRIECVDLVERLVAGQIRARTADKLLSAEVPLFLDVADTDRYAVALVDPRMAHHIAASMTGGAAESSWQGVCALSGRESALEDHMFPAPKLASMGETYLLSMNEDVPSQDRYGLSGMRIFPVGRALVAHLENALKWIAARDREGSTWRLVPGVRRESSDLLLAYLDALPTIDARLAAVFSSGQGTALSETQFEAACQSAIDSVRAHPCVPASSVVRLLVLRKVDKGRAQVVLTREISVDRLSAASKDWIVHCCRNHPPIGMSLPTRKGEEAVWGLPPTLFPDEPVRLLRRQWQKRGTEWQEAPSCTLQEAFDLFLPPAAGSRSTAASILRLGIQRAAPLLGGLRQGELRVGSQRRRSHGGERRIEGLKLVSLFAILLYRLDRLKEVYMNDAAYKLGELLALADTLHSEYCRIRRKGSYPPQLVGNALLPAAAGNPSRTLARLADRLRIYQAWARTAQGDVALAKWTLGRCGEVSRTLHETGFPDRLDDTGKAELLLGYLARPGRTPKDDEKAIHSDETGGSIHDE